MRRLAMVALVITCLLLAALYFYYTRTFQYWAKRGVKHDYPIPFFGTNIKNYLLRVSRSELSTEVYKKYPNEQLVGSYRGTRPELIVRDPELAKVIMISDFNSFHRRVGGNAFTRAVLMQQPVNADDDMWRQLRLRWTPAFSSGKIKAMFSVIIERVESLQARLRAIAASGQTVDAKDLMARFTVDVVGSVGFGVECNSLNNDNDAMRQIGIKIFSINISRVILLTLQNLMPETFEHLNLFRDIEKDVIEMFQSITKHRNYEPSGRHDFIDLLLKIKKKGAMTGDSIVQMNDDGTPKKVSIEMDDAIMAAQSFVFFVAGFDTASAVSSYTLNELAHNPRIQEKAQEEIDRVLARHDNKISYEAISEMTYLKWCLYEAVRAFPFPGLTMRQSVHAYTFPGTDVTIGPGIRIIIPIEAYHNDPKIFPEPQVYRPERFDPSVMTPEQKVAFLPFGSGPRACVGERLGVMLAMSALATTLSKCSVRPAPGAPRRPILSPVSIVISLFKNGVPLVFHERKKEDDGTLM